MNMRKIVPAETKTVDMHQFMLGSVAPRPIAFASTISAEGVPNLAPYSFFNAFSSNPPIVIFSSNRRVANNTTKDTLKNVEDTRQVVINVVPHRIVRQMALTSVEYDAGISEFEKAGLTPVESEVVKPFRVAESPVHMECEVIDIQPLGEDGGAGNLIFCKIVLMHIAEDILTEKNRIDPDKIDLMGRMGRFYYARASGDAVQEIVQRVKDIGIGFDGLPEQVRNSSVLTGNNLGWLASVVEWPDLESARQTILEDANYGALLEGRADAEAFHRAAKEALDAGNRELGAALAALG